MMPFSWGQTCHGMHQASLMWTMLERLHVAAPSSKGFSFQDEATAALFFLILSWYLGKQSYEDTDHILTGAGDGKVKFWDMRKTDKPSWQLTAPSPGTVPQGAAQALTPTPRTKTKVIVL